MNSKIEKKNRWFQISKLQAIYLIGGVLALLLGFWMGSLWGTSRDNLMLALLTILLLPAGAFLIYKGIKRPEVAAVIVGAKAPIGVVNSVNIYAKKDENGKLMPERVAFENVKKPLGQPQQCVNNGNWYFVHIFDLVTGKLKPFVLPDSQYFDPAEFANVINMPAHKKLFTQKVSLLQKIAPGILLVAFIASAIALVAVGG